jgi:hypothetical protein
MEALPVRALVNARQARVLLDSYVAGLVNFPGAACKQSDLAKLPLAFQARAKQAEAQGSIWSAWTDGRGAWLFVGHLNLHRAHQCGQPVLEIDAYDHQHRTKTRSVARQKPDGSWHVQKD